MKISVILFLIISLGLVVYSNSLGNDFIWDDDAFVVRNDFIKNLKLIPSYFTSKEALAWKSLAGENYRPFLPLSFAIDYWFWRLNPLGYHISNLVFHIANAMLIFCLITLITRDRFISLFTSLFFLTHPIQTESVTWISGRADVLFLFFYLLSLIAYINYTKTKEMILYLFSLMVFSFSLLSKEMAVSLPLILILYDMFYGKKEKISLRAIRYFAFFLILEAYLFTRFNIIGKLAQCDYWAGTLYLTLLSMAKGIVYYIRLLIYPVNLCADYLAFPLPDSIKEPQVIFSITIIILLLAGAIKVANRFKGVSFSIFWFFITLTPVTNIIPLKMLIAERFLYLPSIGYCFVIAVLLMSLSDRFKRIPVLKYARFYSAFILVFVYSYLTMMRNVDWSDDITFWKKNAQVYPDNHRAHHNLASAYISRNNDIDKAYEHASRALEISPPYPHPRMIIASCYVTRNSLDDAVKELKQAIKADPDFLNAYIYLGDIYVCQNKYASAYNEYKKVLAKDPDFLEAKLNIAGLYSIKGDVDLAIEEYKKILREKPPYHYRSNYAAAYLRLGDLYASIGDNNNAIKSWKKVSADFNDEIWFSEISRFLTEEIGMEELLRKTESWQPEFKLICYYHVGIKKEMDGDLDAAKIYYRKSFETATETFNQIKALAARRLEKIEEK